MKITGIDIGEYRQFKNIKFDFTYPEGHKKAGQPLDKVCFIGQSGTGKTTLLNVIWEFVGALTNEDDFFFLQQIPSIFSLITQQNQWPEDTAIARDLYSISSNQGNYPITCIRRLGSVDGKVFDGFMLSDTCEEILKKKPLRRKDIAEKLTDNRKACLYIKDSISREADAFLFDQKDSAQTFSDFVKTDIQIEKERVEKEARIKKASDKKIISLGEMSSISVWQYLLRAIDQYNDKSWELLMNLRKQGHSPSRMVSELTNWQAQNKDPKEELAINCLNPLLKSLFLEMDTDVADVPIAIRTSQGVKINSSLLSTGTRQLLATAIPIYKFDTNGTVILFDEPERSLFPDIQRELVKYYTGLAPEAQFFFATHSPIIAAAFEPCERFILYFDENGEVKFRKGVAPIGDDPNDILSEDFGLNELMLDEGLEAYQRYRNLGMAIRNEQDPQRKNELIVERAKLGDAYRF